MAFRPTGMALFPALFLISAVFFLAGFSGAKAAELVMFESTACTWCERWDEEIAPIYPKTAEAKIAPLRRVDIDDDLPADLMGIKAVVYTPTFVLMHRGKEIGRILGYPGEDFFWAYLEDLVGKLSLTKQQSQQS